MQNFKAVIFDLDGVITKTALIHSKAWKTMFDEYLKYREDTYGEKFREFTHTNDYLPYVDGKPRYKGVKSFLESRGINIPYGTRDDSPEKESVCGLGNRKNSLVLKFLASDGAQVYPSTISLIHLLKSNNIKLGVASSSKNCKAVLESANILDLFDTRVDGVVSAELHLKGKPEPDIFTTASDNLGIPYDQAIVVEDAVSGVQAGSNGNFGLVIGIARENNANILKNNGADIVVKDLEEMPLERIEKWFNQGLIEDSWSISYNNYIPEKEGTRESLLTVGNGFFGTRGAFEETKTNLNKFINYPGTYIAGVYNRLKSTISEKTITNEDFVNCPNWIPITFRIGNGKWFDPNSNDWKIEKIERRLDFRSGKLHREMKVIDLQGNETLIKSNRFAGMHNHHLGMLKYSIQPLNYNEEVSFKSEIDGTVQNLGVARYRQLKSKHLDSISQSFKENKDTLITITNQSKILIGNTSRLTLLLNSNQIQPEFIHDTNGSLISTHFAINLAKQQILTIEKAVIIYLNRENDISQLNNQLNESMTKIGSFTDEFQENKEVWDQLWEKVNISIVGDRLSQKLLHMNLYHLLISASSYSADLDVSIPARGLNGEAYRGHIFWDTLFILPIFHLHFPDIVKGVINYRYNRLSAAKEYAKEFGYKGAMFPWQSGVDGKEESQLVHVNPRTGKWSEDHSSLQRHVSLAIAYNVWQYYWTTGDCNYLLNHGMELLLEIARFWASSAVLNEKTHRYYIPKVMGPDEFHEKYPDSKEYGLINNSYTNIMVSWLFSVVNEIFNELSDLEKESLTSKLHLSSEELDLWKDLGQHLALEISENNILAQYKDYFKLKELNWDAYRSKYGNIKRMDRILKAEGLSIDEYKVSKQADALMPWYLFNQEKVKSILSKLNYPVSDNMLSKNFRYYLERTSHGSTLSLIVHSYLANLIGDSEISYNYFITALKSDYNDIQGGTTAEGIHTGVMGGTIYLTLFGYAGLDLNSHIVHLKPRLPSYWQKISFNFNFQGSRYFIELNHSIIKIRIENPKQNDQLVFLNDQKIYATINWRSYPC